MSNAAQHVATLADGYSHSAAAWRDGPSRIYDHLARTLVDSIPSIDGASALDLGAGTGAATRALVAAGARVTASDLAAGMLRLDASERPPAVVADALSLPFRNGAFDIVVAAFVLNHVTNPARGLREMARVTSPGGSAVASAYAADDDHPVKTAVSAAAHEFGWQPSDWMHRLRHDAMPMLATVESAQREMATAGVIGSVARRLVRVPDLDAGALVDWRLGMVDMAPFVTTLDQRRRTALREHCLELLGPEHPPLIRSIIVIRLNA